MSFTDIDLPDAKNSIKNTLKSRYSEAGRIQVSEKMDPSQTQDDENIKYFHHVMCFGTFDIFHPGHIFYLSEAKKYAKKMTIIIARDHRVSSGKGRDPVNSEDSRQQTVASNFPTANVILGDASDIFAPLRELEPDLLAFGYDQRVPEDIIRTTFPQIEIVRIGGFETEKWKSSLLRKKLEIGNHIFFILNFSFIFLYYM